MIVVSDWTFKFNDRKYIKFIKKFIGLTKNENDD